MDNGNHPKTRIWSQSSDNPKHGKKTVTTTLTTTTQCYVEIVTVMVGLIGPRPIHSHRHMPSVASLQLGSWTQRLLIPNISNALKSSLYVTHYHLVELLAYLTTFTGWPKNWHTFMYALTSYALTLSNIDRFSNLFHRQNRENICNNNIVTKDSTTAQACLYTSLWNVNVFRTKIENKTTSVTTHFNSVLSSCKADTLNIWCKNCRMRQLL